MKLSVALAYYDGAEYIDEQLVSILSQLDRGDEVVISVDRALDGSMDQLKSWEEKDSRIFLTQGPAKGIVKNFEHAIKMCSGDLIFFSDQDDVWCPEKVSRVKAAFHDPDVMAVVHDAVITDGGLREIYPSLFEKRRPEEGFVKNLWRKTYTGCCMAVRKELIKAALPFPEAVYMYDYWIGVTAEHLGKVAWICEPLILYRRHKEGTEETLQEALFSKGRNRFLLLLEVIKWRNKNKKRGKE